MRVFGQDSLSRLTETMGQSYAASAERPSLLDCGSGHTRHDDVRVVTVEEGVVSVHDEHRDEFHDGAPGVDEDVESPAVFCAFWLAQDRLSQPICGC